MDRDVGVESPIVAPVPGSRAHRIGKLVVDGEAGHLVGALDLRDAGPGSCRSPSTARRRGRWPRPRDGLDRGLLDPVQVGGVGVAPDALDRRGGVVVGRGHDDVGGARRRSRGRPGPRRPRGARRRRRRRRSAPGSAANQPCASTDTNVTACLPWPTKNARTCSGSWAPPVTGSWRRSRRPPSACRRDVDDRGADLELRWGRRSLGAGSRREPRGEQGQEVRREQSYGEIGMTLDLLKTGVGLEWGKSVVDEMLTTIDRSPTSPFRIGR